ncbi:MAG TPA: hypothetical protein DDX54_01830 [Rhodospirillaceae bacterium]|jgi:hypothetical protein|nr:peptidoglycan-binding protein [Alphaproteobacteria bacterium]HBH26126.1 hypothetical protein [Rhodospirillaceae bacterium]
MASPSEEALPSQEAINELARAAHAGDKPGVNMMLDAFPDGPGRRELLMGYPTQELEFSTGKYTGVSAQAAAIAMGHEKVAIALIEAANGNIDILNKPATKDYSEINIYGAAVHAQDSVIKAFLDAGVSINARGLEGATPAHGAAYRGHVGTSLQILRHGADPTLTADGEELYDVLQGKTPAGWAEARSDPKNTQWAEWREKNPEFVAGLPKTAALWHAAEVAWTTNDTAKLDDALDRAQAAGVDRGELTTAIAQGLANAEKPPKHAGAIIAHLEGQAPDADRTAQADADASRLFEPLDTLAKQFEPQARGEVRQDEFKRVQKALAQLGYPVGKPDGVVGARTIEAIGRFAADNGLPFDPTEGLTPSMGYKIELAAAKERGALQPSDSLLASGAAGGSPQDEVGPWGVPQARWNRGGDADAALKLWTGL